MKTKKKVVGYCRVSTKKGQEYSLEKQQQEITRHCEEHNLALVKIYIEKESGKRDSRPKLAMAMRLCKQENATLVIATLDRLSRNVSFLFQLKDSELDFVALDIPELTTLSLGILATIAQHERETISKRVKKGLEIARSKGRVGGQKKGYVVSAKTRKAGTKAKREKAKMNTLDAARLIKLFLREGKTLAQMCRDLEELGVKTSTGKKKWYPATIRRIIKLHDLKGTKK